MTRQIFAVSERANTPGRAKIFGTVITHSALLVLGASQAIATWGQVPPLVTFFCAYLAVNAVYALCLLAVRGQS